MPEPQEERRPLTSPNDPDLRLCAIADVLLQIPPDQRWNVRTFSSLTVSYGRAREFTGSEAYEAMMFLHKLGLSMEAVKR